MTFITQSIRIGMSFLLGSTGETITEKSGHLNLGIPGIMCVGAAVGCLAENIYLSSVSVISPFLAVLLPIIASFIGSALMGVLYSFLTVTLRANQNVTGLALTTLGIGISKYIIDQILDMKFSQASKYFTSGFPFADKLGGFGEIFLSYGVFVYLAIAIALITSFVLNKTRIGLHLRAVGENPATADAAGVNVTLYRYLATMIGSGIAGLGGLSYIMDNLNGNWEYTVDAIGWLSIALVIFTLWKPNLAIFGSIIFGACYIASSYISGISFAQKEILKMFPYVVTIIVLVVISMRKKREHQPPAALGLPYFREER
ncbi:MAG: ABC transporter permease [Oscillospiraceae bacterium]|nr:ABC transporter permease [Oscillospiraceae bacterium]